MPALITHIELCETPIGSAITDGEGQTNILPQLSKYPTIVRNLSGPDEITLEIAAGSPWSRRASIHFTQHQVIRCTYDDESVEHWSIHQTTWAMEGGSPTTVKARSYLARLATRQIRTTYVTNGYVDITVALVGITAQEALDRIFDPAYNLPPFFEGGTVEAPLNAEIVSIEAGGESDHAHLLGKLCDSLAQANGGYPAEVEAVWNPATNKHTVNVYRQKGWTAAERAAGVADPDLRPIDSPTGDGTTAANRRTANRTHGGRNYFTRLIPIGGEADSPVTIADAIWKVASVSGSSITLEEDVFPVGIRLDAIEPVYAFTGAGSVLGLVTNFSPPRTFTVSGSPGSPADIRFRRSLISPPYQLIHIDSNLVTSADDVVEKTIHFPEIPPYRNLLTLQDITADFSDWSGGMPVGWQALGSPVVSQETDPGYFRYGDRCVKVIAQAGEGIFCQLTVIPTKDKPWFSAWADAYVDEGVIRLEMIDGLGFTQPPGPERAETNARTLQSFSIGGLDPLEHAPEPKPFGTPQVITFKIYARGAPATFYVDSFAVVQNQAPSEYRERMGPEALHLAGVEHVLQEVNTSNVSFDGDVFDKAWFPANGNYDELRPGAWCRIRQIDAETGVVRINKAARIQQTVAEDNRQGRVEKRFRIERDRPSIGNRLLKAPAQPQIPEAPKTIIPNQPPVAIFTYTRSGLTVDVDASASYDPDGTILLYEWDFGDNTTAEGVTASHTFAEPGTYVITLTVTDNEGAKGYAFKSVSVTTSGEGPGTGGGAASLHCFEVVVPAAGPSPVTFTPLLPQGMTINGGFLTLRPHSDWGNTAKWWTSNLTPTSFDLHTSPVPGTNDFVFRAKLEWPCGDVVLPDAPVLVLESITTSEAVLSWTAVTGADGYRLYRADESGGPYTLVIDQAGTSHTDTAGFTVGEDYFWVVTAYTGSTEGPYSNEVMGMPSQTLPTTVLHMNNGGSVYGYAISQLLSETTFAATLVGSWGITPATASTIRVSDPLDKIFLAQHSLTLIRVMNRTGTLGTNITIPNGVYNGNIAIRPDDGIIFHGDSGAAVNFRRTAADGSFSSVVYSTNSFCSGADYDDENDRAMWVSNGGGSQTGSLMVSQGGTGATTQAIVGGGLTTGTIHKHFDPVSQQMHAARGAQEFYRWDVDAGTLQTISIPGLGITHAARVPGTDTMICWVSPANTWYRMGLGGTGATGVTVTGPGTLRSFDFTNL